jgi:hypothetical protein
MERRPEKFAVGLLAIILITMSVIQCRFDEMTARHRPATKRCLESLNSAARAEQFAPRTAS